MATKPQLRYQPGDKIGGRYQVHKALTGGMGEVYLCLDLKTNQPYALKTFQQRYLTERQRLQEAFEREVATWVALEKHPNIVNCFWMQSLDNQPFMALEWIAGEKGKGTDLRSWLHHGPLDLKMALEIAIDICRGLIHIQGKQPRLVHCDLKPENILMAQGGLAKITDFGLAQVAITTGMTVTQEGAAEISHQNFIAGKGIAGTPAYMAPEQWRGEELDERTDLYALGCMLYELVSGQLPFVGNWYPTTPQQWQSWLKVIQVAHETTPAPKLPEGPASDLDEIIQMCMAKMPDARPATLVAMLNQLIPLYQQNFRQPPPARPAPAVFAAIDYNNRGITYAELGQHKAALSDYNCAIDLDSKFAMAYANRGTTHAEMRQYNLAMADFERALALNQNLAQAYSSRGVAYVELEQHKQALENYNRAIELDPNFSIAYSNRGNVYKALKEYNQALSDYGQAIKLNPADAKNYYNRAVAYYELGMYVQSLNDYDQAIELDPHDAQAYSNRGNTYKALGQYIQALDDYNRSIEINPNLALTYSNRGNTYKALGRYRQALNDYDRAIELNPSLAQAYTNRGVTYADLEQYKQALDNYHQAIHVDPTYAQTYTNLGALLGNEGKLEEALAYFEQAAQLGDEKGAQYAEQVKQMLEM